MVDIFVSYSSDDRDRVVPIVDALAARGWTLWWDKQIEIGSSYDTRIEEALSGASCVVVVWSKNSVRSEWVQSEALEGLNRGILVPVCLEEIELPLAFRRTQTAMLENWPQGGDEEFDKLIHGINHLLSMDKSAALPEVDPNWKAQINKLRSLQQLKKMAVIGAVLIGAILTGFLGWSLIGKGEGPNVTPSAILKPLSLSSIAVLPLENLAGGPEQGYFVAGMHDALITSLSKVSGLSVISRTSTLGYKDTVKLIPQIGKELGVGSLIEGSVYRTGNQLRINIQLIDATTDRHIWAETFDREIKDVLKLQSEITRAITEQVAVALTPDEEKRLAQVKQVNPETYEAYLRGMYLVQQATKEEMNLGISLLKEAVAKNPDDALAWAGLALAWNSIGHGPSSRSEALPNGKAAALKAIELDDTLAEAHAALGESLIYYDWDWEGSERAYKRALELNPNLAIAHAHYAFHHALFGRWEEAIEQEMHAHKLDPRNPVWTVFLGYLTYYGGYPEEALKWTEVGSAINDDFPFNNYLKGLLFSLEGRFEESIASHRRAKAATSNFGWGLPHALAMAGQEEEARELLAELTQAEIPDTWAIALIYIELGDHDEAFKWLEVGYDQRRDWIPWIGVDSAFAALWDDPRMNDLLRRMNLPHDAD